MKQKILNPTTDGLKLSTVILPIIIGIMLVSAGCQKDEEPEFSGPVEGYIVGSFRCWVVDENGQGTSNQTPTPRGFCILLDGNKNTNSQKPMDFYTFDIPEDFFDLPVEILLNRGYDCGPSFFPDSLQAKFRISFEYRDTKESEKLKFSCGMCPAIYRYFPWNNYNQIDIKNIIKK